MVVPQLETLELHWLCKQLKKLNLFKNHYGETNKSRINNPRSVPLVTRCHMHVMMLCFKLVLFYSVSLKCSVAEFQFIQTGLNGIVDWTRLD